MNGGTAIGLDVGGTKIRAALVDRGGAVLARMAEPVRGDRDGFSDQVRRLIAAVRDRDSAGVGIGIPGRVDAAQREILSAGYLDIAGLDLGTATDLPVRVENDAAMALIAEIALRPAPPRGLVALVTVGTGIGGAVALDGVPWYGGGLAGQFGHLTVAADGPRCNCGRRGCVETFSSGTALGGLIRAAGLPGGTDVARLLREAEAGDPGAGAILDTWAAPFRRALDSLVAAIDPRLILVGGGLGAAMTKALDRLPVGNGWFQAPVEPARLGDEAGVIGAGLCGFGAAG